MLVISETYLTINGFSFQYLSIAFFLMNPLFANGWDIWIGNCQCLFVFANSEVVLIDDLPPPPPPPPRYVFIAHNHTTILHWFSPCVIIFNWTDFFVLACPAGTYADNEGFSSCLTCPRGYYCLNATSNYLGNLCPKGHYCPPGTKEPYEYQCPPGTFNDKLNMQNSSACLSCEGGKYCEGFGNERPTNSCDPGFYCPFGAQSATPAGNKCQPRYYCPRGSTHMVPCIAGMYCDMVSLAYPAGECDPGFYCPNGSASRTEKECPSGYYCGKGSARPDACPSGTFLPSTKAFNQSQCLNCTAGWYCNDTGLSAPNGECESGYYCPTGQNVKRPPLYMCPKGHYCKVGYPLPKRCENGTYQDNDGQSSCKVCESGYYCDNTLVAVTTVAGRECPMGSYCPRGTRFAREFGCLRGTWSNRTGLNDYSQCDPCPPRYGGILLVSTDTFCCLIFILCQQIIKEWWLSILHRICIEWVLLSAKAFKYFYNIPRACLLNRPPVPAMDLKAIDQACDVTC